MKYTTAFWASLVIANVHLVGGSVPLGLFWSVLAITILIFDALS